MREPTRSRLAKALAAVPGTPPDMIRRAIDGYYDDYASPLAFPLTELVGDLQKLRSLPTTGPKAELAINDLIRRAATGEFDGTKEEAVAWAASAEGQQVFSEIFGDGS